MNTRIYYTLTLCAFLLHATAHAQGPYLTPEKLWELGRVSLDDISPDGRTALYGVTWYDLAANKGKRDLYVVPVAGGEARPVAAFETSVSNALYRPDGKRIAFLKGGRLWEMDPDGSNDRQVSEEPMNGFRWSPDGRYIVFTRDVPGEPGVRDLHPDLPQATGQVYDDLMYRHWDSWHDRMYSNVFYVAYRDGRLEGPPVNIMNEPFDAPLNPHGGMEEIAFSPDSRYIAYTCKKSSGAAYAVSTDSDIYLYELATARTVNLTEGMEGYDREPVFSPDGKRVMWSSMATPGFEADRNRIFLLDLRTRQQEELTEGLDLSAHHPRWMPDGASICFSAAKGGTVPVFRMDLETRKTTRITSGPFDYAGFGVAGPGTLVGMRMSMSDPVELYRIDLPSGKETRLTHTNRDVWDPLRLGQVASRTVKTTDGKDMQVWVIFPPDFDPGKKYPTLLYCQGGPQSPLSQFFSYRWNFQMMAARGYIVVAPNRRGLPGFGQAWNDQISGDWGGQAMQDLLSAIDDVRREPWVDNDRLGAVGASYGGYSVYWLAGHHEGRFKSFISHCGTFNLESWFGTTEEVFFARHDLGGAYWEKDRPKTYADQSPHKFVANWDTPILVIHNEKDFRVPVGEGLQAFQAARLQGIKSRFLYFPDEGHWVLKPQNSVLWQRVFFQWLEETLGTAEP